MTKPNRLCTAIALATIAGCTNFGPSPCDRLETLQFDDAVVTSVAAKSAGHDFFFRGLLVGKPFFKVPESCRVSLRLHPSPDSDIHSQIWLPQSDWNGKFLGIGNGGFAGSVDILSLTVALQRGYAAASTDTGHEGDGKDGTWALGHPEKVRDYGYRAIHETTVKAKRIIKHFYGRPPDYAYFSSCSNGGRAGLMEAQRFPGDYDGIVAGAPAYFPSSMLPVWAWMQQQMLDQPGAYIPEAKINAIAKAVERDCDAQDGVEDGVLNDPSRCSYQPESLQCAGTDNDHCLTAAQVESLKAIYNGPGGTLDGQPNRGFEPGGELAKRGAWKNWFTGSKPGNSMQYRYALQFYRYLVFNDPDWNLEDFEFERDQRAMREVFRDSVDAVNADLSEFKARGGKLILYHGWNDAAVPPRYSIDYYNAIKEKLGGQGTEEFVRLYMVPGMQHCAGGPGANNFGAFPPAGNADPHHNINAALEAWVERGEAPGSIVATKVRGNEFTAQLTPEKSDVKFSRLLCPYPQVARWTGEGSSSSTKNYECVKSTE